MAVGDIWTNTTNGKLYRYNGTNWTSVYSTNINEIRKDVETVTETTTKIETDLGNITQQVGGIESTVNTLGYKSETEGIAEICLDNTKEAEIIKLEVKGNKTYINNLFPNINLQPRTNLFPNQKG